MTSKETIRGTEKEGNKRVVNGREKKKKQGKELGEVRKKRRGGIRKGKDGKGILSDE